MPFIRDMNHSKAEDILNQWIDSLPQEQRELISATYLEIKRTRHGAIWCFRVMVRANVSSWPEPLKTQGIPILVKTDVTLVPRENR